MLSSAPASMISSSAALALRAPAAGCPEARAAFAGPSSSSSSCSSLPTVSCRSAAADSRTWSSRESFGRVKGLGYSCGSSGSVQKKQQKSWRRKKLGTAMATMAPARPQEQEQGREGEEAKREEDVGSNEDKTGTFSWKDHWYPVSLVEDLDPELPTPYQVLGREIVVWKDREGSWRAFLDKCPHRLAPLSEGRIDENGWLQCSYHGWSFKPDGACGVIPQAATEGPEAKAQFSPRACATTLPTLVSDGLLFIWPDDKGWDKARETEPPRLPPAFVDPEFAVVNIQRDLFYGYDTLMENVSDPSHIDFAHHKVTGRRDRAKSLPFQVEESGHWGFKGSNSDTPKITTGFLPPCYYYNKIEIPAPKLPFSDKETWTIWICSFNVPMAPGKTRSIVCSARNFFQFTVPGPEWWKIMPRWYEHWTSNKVYDGDMIVLQGQEKYFSSSGNYAEVSKNYTKLTYTPTQADRFVLAFRSWLRRHGKGQPEWFPETDMTKPLPSLVLSKRQMLDRFEQHTLICSSCRKALENFRLAQKVLWGATVALAAGAGVPPEMSLRLVLAASAVICAGLAFLLKESEKNFIFKDYVHAKID
ncbi:pheophorbide a oxygenase [Marchantia polymorpha subsp. ruderalis]|uniref:Rieske domain-containing protein n=2 Tax=Marchantia polymorpha TaxID=3197 RepID=A0AAF6BUY4_MARPO|nr:hypothetical protein MARPO_0046s0012 [Marchantia polymorpha]BBN15818.1 hypothetical protein Mp_7g01120 [Marchantia polymorpha subsp. ruderalis]|eukprot:PTQ39187.1 hypothetical protein MARPO_0046s0012 [Marchantia polymorpha]